MKFRNRTSERSSSPWRLNRTRPWHEQINMTGGRNTGRRVTFEGLRRSSLATFPGPLALLPLPKKIEMAKGYWKAVSETWPDAWHDVPLVIERVNPRTNEWEQVEESVKYPDQGPGRCLSTCKNRRGHPPGGLRRSKRIAEHGHGPRTARPRQGINWVKSKDNPDMNAQAGFSGLADMYDMLLQRIYGGDAPSS